MAPSRLPAMIYRPSRPTAARVGCGTCEHFRGEWVAHGAHAVCRFGGRRQVQAQPSQGCAFHARAPGSDDG